MRQSKDTTLRYLKLLTELPVFPHKISTSELRQKLERLSLDYQVSARTMQRDMEKLSGIFPIGSVDEGKSRLWFWTEKTAFTQIPAMSEQTALTLRLTEAWLTPLLPRSSLSLLRPYFKHARAILKNTRLNTWTDKVSIVSESQALITPEIKKDVQETVYEALLQNKKLIVQYRRRGELATSERLLNPLGLVARKQTIYLVASAWEYTDPWHYALHRIRSAKIQTAPAKKPPGFKLDAHIHTDKAFSYPVSSGSLQLKVRVNEQLATHLRESKLADDQKTKTQRDGRVLITATVKDTSELRWWLLGLGAAIEVIAPESLRTEMKEYIVNMQKLYSDQP